MNLEERSKRKGDLARLMVNKNRRNIFADVEFLLLEENTMNMPMIWEEEVIERKMFKI